MAAMEARGRRARPRSLPPPAPVLRCNLVGKNLRRGGTRYGGDVTSFKFVGPIPEWIDPETFGWPFSEARVIFVQDDLHREIEAINRHRHPDDDGISLPQQPIVLPPVQEVWWNADLHTPYLLWKLFRGKVRAFGDPGRAGSPAEWIPQRLWKDLKPSPENNRLFAGGGSTFWNVRIAATGEVIALADAQSKTDPENKAQSQSKKASSGGRGPSDQLYDFIAELLRLANGRDGLPEDRRALKKHMVEWSTRTFEGGGPSETTIKSWLARFVPDGGN